MPRAARFSCGSPCVGHQSRVLDQAFHPAQTLCQRKDAAAFQEPQRPFQPSLQHGTNHAAETVHLPTGQVVLRMTRQTGIDDAGHARRRSSHSAIRNALWLCRSIGNWSVFKRAGRGNYRMVR